MTINDELVHKWLVENSNLAVDFLFGCCFIYGLITNSLVLYVCCRTNLKQIPTFIFIALGAIINILSLFFAPLNNFTGQFIFEYYPRDRSLIWCRILYFSAFFLLHWTIWLLVLSNVEIYLTVKIVRFRPRYSNVRCAILSSLFIGIFFALFNSPKIILHGFERDLNGTSQVFCFRSTHDHKAYELIGQFANAFWDSFMPSVVIIVVNILLYKELTTSKLKLTNVREKQLRVRLENRRTAKTHLFYSLAYLFISVPKFIAIILYIVFRNDFNFLLLKLINLLSHVYFNSTLFILLAKNVPFRSKFICYVLACRPDDWRRQSTV